MKHTPGPWFTSQPHQTIYIESRIGGGMLQEIGAIGPTEGGPRQQEANARLIAAAPDLLEALRMSVAAFEGDKLDEIEDGYGFATAQRIAAARAAIAKATKEQA